MFKRNYDDRSLNTNYLRAKQFFVSIEKLLTI